ncbi:MAG: PEPxxWA-CTERM sorting domain-containing protein [Alphaproteobacteria bacterium]|nr:PEPxxWA-CTERM sorting domain-containing protein [Alphaproteobacteria bacterium]MBU1515528.1 PEPxxWA-CTERM sorting domain-containing protein [Alphaproteobacteria bacterium]MBU2095526.1 PEPxxWA-CTERM sorting domain-containing protein [Alphaproteobacteria bacterium]MBU2150767.1 PEPxxWA-CTERM sorting domain-containing protein [Alphaproteobacteria bacterium]MBU2307032.1 PEPxxWA-CTERM sorting domain-containing protein [Alphaproteobacteria bacterium]
MKHTLLLAGAALTLAMTHPAAAATNLIVNGDFNGTGNFAGEYITITGDNPPAGFGWSVTGSVDVFKTDSRFGGDPDPIGGDPYALDLVGVGTEGGIYQPFFTQAGKTYRLTFDFANNPFIGSAAMQVGLLGGGDFIVKEDVFHSGSTTTAMDWQTMSFEFTAVDDISFVSFKNTAGAFAGGMYLDNVSVVDLSESGVPEPATWALMIAGFGLAGTALRSRRRLAPTAV